MIHFKNPWFFLLIIPVILAAFVVLFANQRKNFAAKLSDTIPNIQSLRAQLFNIVPPLLKMIVLLLIVVALARPQRVDKDVLPPAEGIDIMLALDTSYSMAAMDFNPFNRLEAAQKAAASFVAKRMNDRIGVTVFGGAALLSCPLTLDYNSVLSSINSATLNMTMADGTAVGDAIVTAVNHLKDSKAKSKVIILLTDGRSNVGLIKDMTMAANAAKSFGIKIYTIGTAGIGPAPIYTGDPLAPVLTIDEDLDEPGLREIAAISGGEFYRAKNYKELSGIYEKIDSLEKTKFEVKTSASYTDLHNYLLIPALVILTLVLVAERTYFRSIP